MSKYHPESMAGRLAAEGYTDAEIVDLAPTLIDAMLYKYMIDYMARTSPNQAFGALNKVGIAFSAEQEAQIHELVEAGNLAKAQRALIDALRGRG